MPVQYLDHPLVASQSGVAAENRRTNRSTELPEQHFVLVRVVSWIRFSHALAPKESPVAPKESALAPKESARSSKRVSRSSEPISRSSEGISHSSEEISCSS
jgi:hypothetical protein